MAENSNVVRVIIVHPAGNAKSTVELPINVPINRLIRALVKRLALPETDPQQRIINYSLAHHHKIIDETLTLQLDQTLGSADIQEDDELRLTVTRRTDSLKISDMSVEDFIRLLNTNKSNEESGFIVKPVFGDAINDPSYQCNVFVVMPFNSEFNHIYKRTIQPVGSALGLKVGRADDMFTIRHNIITEIWSSLRWCDVVVADCTGRNPNVFYELGIAHTIGKPCILLTQNIDDVPFDVKGWRFIEYKYTVEGIDELREKLTAALKVLLAK